MTLFMDVLACGFTYLLYPLRSPMTSFGTLLLSPTERIWMLQHVHKNITAWAYLIVWDQSRTPWEMEGDMEWIQKMAAGSLSQYGHRMTMSYIHSLRQVSKVKIMSPAATRLTQRAYVLMLRHSQSKIRLLYFSTGAETQRHCACVCRNTVWLLLLLTNQTIIFLWQNIQINIQIL